MFRLALARRSNMYAVGRILSQGVYTVAGPFHPFGGAVDIIVVQQQDGSYKSSPWYVKFGKFQGVLKRSEKVVDIAVNDKAVPFHMYLDSKGEAYFLKDSEPDKDPSSSQLAITAGDEVLTIEAGPSKLDAGLECKEEFADAKEDVEEAESSDEKDSNLELRFEGRKASYLLVQQARAAEEAKHKGANNFAPHSESISLVEGTDLFKNDEPLEDCKLKDTDTPEEDQISEGCRLKEDAGIIGEIQHLEIGTLEKTEILGDSELSDNIILKDSFDVLIGTEAPEGTTLKEELVARGEASDNLLSSLAALKSRNSVRTSVEEFENASVGSAIHALFNQALGLEEAQKSGRPSSKFIAQAAFTAVAKAALEPGDEGSSEGLGNGTGYSFELLSNKGDATEGFRRGKSKSLNMGFEFTADEPVHVRRIKSESELRLLETSEKESTGESDMRTNGIRDNSSESPTLMIASADGVVVLHTPRCGSPPPLTSQDDQTQQPTLLEGDGVEEPSVPGVRASDEILAEGQGNTEVEKADPSSKKNDSNVLLTPENGGWKLWPFPPLRRSKIPVSNGSTPNKVSNKALLVAAKVGVDTAIVQNLVSDKKFYNLLRKSFLPTSQMLAEMNLKEGSNRITFTFQTRVLGKQQVDARVYLWKWNTRVVISDVDGTITKSDVLGQVMPLVGRDWTQSGVTRLFSAIKENGYEVMFLSARAISQAYLTRQFLVNLKQDGEALPDGPVVISPDGLFPSLYREVIRRAPHEFKIACLQDIRDLFPKDCNPFYAGFGNRETDEISYLKVGIPKGKIFIINPKGEVAVNNRVDVKSYTSLHKLVDDMFPPQSCTEQEDFNSWNFWKMPLPDIEDEISVKSASKPKKTK